jgi:hypothetical protein
VSSTFKHYSVRFASLVALALLVGCSSANAVRGGANYGSDIGSSDGDGRGSAYPPTATPSPGVWLDNGHVVIAW